MLEGLLFHVGHAHRQLRVQTVELTRQFAVFHQQFVVLRLPALLVPVLVQRFALAQVHVVANRRNALLQLVLIITISVFLVLKLREGVFELSVFIFQKVVLINQNFQFVLARLLLDHRLLRDELLVPFYFLLEALDLLLFFTDLLVFLDQFVDLAVLLLDYLLESLHFCGELANSGQNRLQFLLVDLFLGV